ncbi:hypothetical protein CAPTEDRAFT_202543 [Capitella teleta]|uniref:Uncharacterized protein n=1 Tax=Capitella teleta TaxID=283909 RepID=R7V5P6_CAPTE|nr:hypothetical protein CAPTEDRAFT_202543 [Capitella teleta]|eukprot:ELU13899.1 hypothetical protein CAPTEDRAFT_202543 [Capitella teleta]
MQNGALEMLPIEHREQNRGCCMKPPSPAMNVDCALNELGMLSSVTQSRRQFLAEKGRRRSIARERYLSEPPADKITDASSTYVPRSRPQISETPSPETPLNSPLKGSGFHILQLNMNYVTQFSTHSSSSSPKDNDEAFSMETKDEGQPWEHLGKDYASKESHPRSSKSKGPSRLRRLKKPYEIPWRHSIESYYSDQTVLPSPSSSFFNNCVSESKTSSCSSSSKTTTRVCSSNSSTPEKSPSCSSLSSASLLRSKSLDDLNLAKLKLATTETQEMERVSQHFNDLHVGE